MKKYIITLVMALFSITSLHAMGYEEAREQARFLTDKMAYELNLNDEQYNMAYEINLDYLMNLRTADDVYGNYLTYRNADIRCILLDWQWSLFSAADYFFHPIYWRGGGWYYPIYGFYNRGYFYYDRPRLFLSYRGGHGWRHNGGRSFYDGRRPRWNGGFRGHDFRGSINNRGGNYGGRPGNGIGNRTNGGRGNGFSVGSQNRPNRNGNVTPNRGNSSTNGGRGNGFSIGSQNRGNGNVTPNRGNSSTNGGRNNGFSTGSQNRGNGTNGSSVDNRRQSSTRTTVTGRPQYNSGSRNSGSSSFSRGSSSTYSRGSMGGSSRSNSSSSFSRGSSSSSFGGSTRSSGGSSFSRGGGSSSHSSMGGGSHSSGSSRGGGRR